MSIELLHVNSWVYQQQRMWCDIFYCVNDDKLMIRFLFELLPRNLLAPGDFSLLWNEECDILLLYINTPPGFRFLSKTVLISFLFISRNNKLGFCLFAIYDVNAWSRKMILVIVFCSFHLFHASACFRHAQSISSIMKHS